MTILNFTPPFQTPFTIETNSNNLINALKLKYGGYIKVSSQKLDNIIIVTQGNDNYKVCFDNKYISTTSPLQAIDDIFFKYTNFNDNIFAIHGAAVEHKHKAYIFLAATESGKSTLTSYLTSNGFGYITDDCILLDKQNFSVHPFPTPIQLRSGGLDVLKKLNIEPKETILLNTENILRYVYTPDNCINTPTKLDKIFFIARNNDNNFITQMSSTERVIGLMKSSLIEQEISAEYLKFISSLSKVECLTLDYSDLGFVAEVMKNG